MTDSRFTGPLRLRFAPSPTGDLHVGSLRTALFNYLLRLKYGGSLVLRIEDTDAGRNVPDAEQRQQDDLTWAGIRFDEKVDEGGTHTPPSSPPQAGREIPLHTPYRQSERGQLYREALLKLVESGAVFRCWCTPERLAEVRRAAEAAGQPPRYDRRCRKLPDTERHNLMAGSAPFVWRLATPEVSVIEVHDLVRGLVSFRASHLDDPILIRSDSSATAVFAGAVDDLLMGITHVIRGEEWLASTPYQIIIGRALGGGDVNFGHLPLLLAPDRTKLSKRHPGSTVGDLRRDGYLPSALNRTLVAIGRGNLQRDEGWDIASLAESFDLSRYGKADAVFSMDMLADQSAHALRRLTLEELAIEARSFLREDFPEALKWQPARLHAALTIAGQGAPHLRAVAGQLAALFTRPFVTPERFTAFARADELLHIIAEEFAHTPADWQSTAIKQTIAEIGNRLGLTGRNLHMPLRLALTYAEHGPEIAAIAELLGRDETIIRLKAGSGKSE